MITNATTVRITMRPAKDGDEADAFSRSSRRQLAAFNRAGVAHKTKTRASRRERRQASQALHLSGHWGHLED